MKSLITVLALLGGLTTAALADHHETEEGAEAGSENACAPAEDCSKLEGDAKAECEKKAAEAKPEEKAEETEEKKGKSMEKSNDGNMESYEESE